MTFVATKLSIHDVSLKSKRVLVRADFNVPLDGSGRITDDSRIVAALPTIRMILEGKGRAILLSHLGRPDAKQPAANPKLRLDPVAHRLQELLGCPVKKLPDSIGPSVQKSVQEMKEGEVVLLENLRFHAGEEANDLEFARKLASLGDLYVNEAFSSSHRAHASITGIPRFLKAVAGIGLKKEAEVLKELLTSPEKPFAVVLGGAKVSDKIGLIECLLGVAQSFLIGGGMAYTFLKARQVEVGASRVEAERLETARRILDRAEKAGVQVLLPRDHLVADRLEAHSKIRLEGPAISDGWHGVDIGPKSIREFTTHLSKAATVFWNGPMGIFEIDKFAEGTHSVAVALSRLPVTTVAGGGDTAAALRKFGLQEKLTHVSTGGGACLEFLEGKELPGIRALTDR